MLPQGFRYLRNYDVFIAMGPIAGADFIVDRGNHQGFIGLGRLKAGMTQDRALTELRGIEASLSDRVEFHGNSGQTIPRYGRQRSRDVPIAAGEFLIASTFRPPPR